MNPNHNLPDTNDPVKLFLALVQIASPSQQERNIVQAICKWLEQRQLSFLVDNASEITGGNSGNIIVRHPERFDPSKLTVLFAAHLDTVQKPEDNIVPVVKNGVIYSSGETILGADNKSAVAALLSVLGEQQISSNANVIAAFTTSEERGKMGASALSSIAEEIDLALPVDGSYPVGTVIDAALGHAVFSIRVVGKSAHAAKEPEQGIHSLQAASQIVSRLQMGWNGNWLLNISSISGEEATNVVPSENIIRGEIRSYNPDDQDLAIAEITKVAQEVSKQSGATIDISVSKNKRTPAFSSTVGLAIKEKILASAKDVGLQPQTIKCQATLEANVLHDMGLPTLGLASGGENSHSTDECIAVSEIESLARFLKRLLLQL